MKILITGAAGYIGSVMVPALLNAGHEITAIDNFMYNQTSLLDCCHDEKLTIVRGDARREELIAEHIKNVDFIFPLACFTGAPACDNDTVGAETTNLGAVKIILKLRNKNQKIIFPNTNSGYGIGQDNIYCDENTPLRPVSLYGKLKVEAEREILKAGNAVTLRLATVFGISPRMRLDLLVNDFVHRALTDRFIVLFEAHFKRNYIHVRDVVKAFAHCMDNFDQMKNEAYNAGLSDCNISKMELCKQIQKILPDFYFTEAAIAKDPDVRNYVVSNAKIEATGFKPDCSLEQGIKELVKGCQVIKRNSFSNL